MSGAHVPGLQHCGDKTEANIPTASGPRIRSAPWRSLFTFARRSDVPLLVSAAICSILAGIANPAQAFITGKVFNGFIQFATGSISNDDFLAQQRILVIGLVALGLASWLFHALEFALWMRFGESQARHVRTQLYDHLATRDISWYDTCGDGIETFLPQLLTQVRDLQLATSQPLGGILSQLSTSILAIGQAFYNSWDLTLVTLAGAPFMVATIVYFGIAMQAAIDKQQAARGSAQSHAFEAIANVETVQCFNAEQSELDKYTATLRVSSQWYGRVTRCNASQMAILAFLVQAMFVQAFFYGGTLIRAGKKQPSQVITTFFSAITAFQALQGIMPQMVILERGKYAGHSLKKAVSDVEATKPTPRGIRPLRCDGKIQLKAVSFIYPARPEHVALRGVDLTIPGGCITFLVGGSGSGKSTIGQLLTRFYEPTSGSIFLDGEVLSSLDIAWLRARVLLVEQSSTLLEGTIGENIELAGINKQAGGKSDLQTAIEFALLQKMILDLPDGIGTHLGMAGQSLSGGQRQRIALARARIRDPTILILDESTSALDQITRELMIDAIRQWRYGKTTIIVTHDLAPILPHDFVIVLRSGEVMQSGHRSHIEAEPLSEFRVLFESTSPTKTHAQDHSPRRISLVQPALRQTSFFAAASIYFDQSPFQGRLGYLTPQMPDARWRSSQHWKHLMENAAQHALVNRGHYRPAGISRRRLPAEVEQPSTARSADERRSPGVSSMLRRQWLSIHGAARIYTVTGFIAGTVHAACSPVFAYVLAKLIGLYTQPQSTISQSLTYSMAILAVAVIDAVSTLAYRMCLERSSQVWIDILRQKGMQALLRQPQDFIDCGEDTSGSLVTTLDEYAEGMRNLFGRYIVMLFVAAVIIIVALIWAISAAWKMTLLAMTAGPYIFFATKAYSVLVEKWERRDNDAAQRVNDVFDEVFGKVKTVRALTLESHFHNRFVASQKDLERVGVSRARWIGFCYGMSTSAATLATALVFYIGTRLVHDGGSITAILQVFTILILTISNVSTILDYVPQVGSAKEMAWRLLRIADLPTTGTLSDRGGTLVNGIGRIDFKDFHFAYSTRPEVTILQNVNLKIIPGLTTAIVGGSGSGKSTIAKLLLKLYSTTDDGMIKISGRDIRSIDTASLRRATAVVAQTSSLFRASIMDNITYGLPAKSAYRHMDNVVKACESAGILEFISSLPETFETVIGASGMGLSGGQVQRIAIARALVRQPSLLILDEATSALDAQSAAKIRDTIHELIRSHKRRMTIVMITHSKEMMTVADKVIVLDRGRVVEQGTFTALTRLDGHLAHLLRGGVQH